MWQGSSVITVLWEERVTDTDISQELSGAPVSKSKVKCSQENTQVFSGTHTPKNICIHSFIPIWIYNNYLKENTIRWNLITTFTYNLKKLENLIYRDILIFSCQYSIVFKEMMSSFPYLLNAYKSPKPTHDFNNCSLLSNIKSITSRITYSKQSRECCVLKGEKRRKFQFPNLV